MILFLLLLATHVEKAEASGTGKIKFVRFKYSSCSDAGGGCDFYFTNIKIVGGDGVEHTIDRKTAPDNTNDVDLTTVIPEITEVALSASRSVRLTMDVRESDFDISSDDDILNINLDVTFPEIEQEDDWVNRKHTYANGAELTISRRITSCDTNFTGPGCNSCKTNHYTSTCDRYCAPVAGNYKCNSNGDKLCEAWKTGANCDQCADSRKTGADCFQCADSKKTGDGCDQCADSKKTGDDCSVCSSGYYGTICSVYCSKTKHYNCSDAGVKICLQENATRKNNCEAVGVDLKVVVGASMGAIVILALAIAGGAYVRWILKKQSDLEQRLQEQESRNVEMASFQSRIYENQSVDFPAGVKEEDEAEYIDNIIVPVEDDEAEYIDNIIVPVEEGDYAENIIEDPYYSTLPDL